MVITAVNKCYHKRTHKFGIEIPKTYKDCVRIDNENGNPYWQDAIRKEMAKVRIAFKTLGDDQQVPPTFQQMRCHMVYDVKVENFQRKACLVAGGHMNKVTSATMTYASVVSRESVWIALTLAALNDLKVKTADIENSYLTAPIGEKIWCTLGPEFGKDAGKNAIIVLALYGLKSAGASFRNHLANCMHHYLGWESCKADHDVWFKPEVRRDDGHQYYAYCLLYVDDILMVHHNGVKALREINHFSKTKPNSIWDHEFYFGAKLRPMTLPNGVVAWGMSESKYVQAAVAMVKTYHAKEYPTRKWGRTSGPFPSDYVPELDTTDLLDNEKAAFYQSQIGVLRWIVELNRIDIITEVSELSSLLAMPCEGHLDALFYLFNYLEKRNIARIVFDPCYPTIDMASFKECDWSSFYGNVHQEAIPPNAPEPRGKDVDLRMIVDSDHAGDKRT
jgi:hypothetical protein